MSRIGSVRFVDMDVHKDAIQRTVLTDQKDGRTIAFKRNVASDPAGVRVIGRLCHESGSGLRGWAACAAGDTRASAPSAAERDGQGRSMGIGSVLHDEHVRAAPRGALQRGMTYEHVGCDARGAGRG